MLKPKLIYDNGASLKNKGTSFSIERLKKHLRDYFKKYKTNEGYILLYDFSNYFARINHNILFEMIDPLIEDERCKKLYHHLVEAFGEEGLGLGSQISQISAVFFPSKIDFWLQHYKEAEASARYMDDGYVIFHTKEDARKCEQELYKRAEELKIVLNPTKIKITKINKSFIFLKKRFFITETGKVVVRVLRKIFTKQKKKIQKLMKLVDEGKLTYTDVLNSHKTWAGQYKKYNNKKALYSIDQQIRRMIDEHGEH